MEDNIWGNEQIESIDNIIERLPKPESSKYKLGWLKRIIRKVDKFQEDCLTCGQYRAIIENHITNIDNSKSNADAFDLKDYNSQITTIYKHLKKEHQIVPEKHFAHLGTIVGVFLGLAFTFIFMDLSTEIEKYGLWVGVAIGFFIGKYLDTKADSEDRVLK